MPSLIEDLKDGLRLFEGEDGKINLSRTFFASDLLLPNPTDPEVLRFASALTLTGVPARASSITVNGRTVYVVTRELEPVPPADAIIRINYGYFNPGIPAGQEFSGSRVSGGTSVRQSDTAFDAVNLALPFASRTPISVSYDESSAGAPGAGAKPQGGRVPIFLPNSTVNFRRYENTDPSGRSRTYASKKNSATWKGLAAGTVLCMGVTFDEVDANLWDAVYSFAYDPDEKWDQVIQYIRDDTGRPPKLTNAQLAAENGAKLVVVQGSADFNALAL